MMRLLSAELNRLRSRRLTWVALLLIVIALGLLQFATVQAVRPLSQQEAAEAQVQFAQAQQEYEQNRGEYEAAEQQCVAQGNAAEDCSQEPKLEYYSARSVLSYSEITTISVTVAVFLTGLAFLFLSASFIGAEFSTGAIGNWLSFIPERGKVFASKLLAVVLGAAVVTAVAAFLTIGVAALITRAVGADVSGVGKLAELGGRGVVVGGIFAVLGFGLALLTRHTIAAAGTVLGYLFLWFVVTLLSQVIPALQVVKGWLPQNHMLAFLNDGYSYSTVVREVTPQGLSERQVEHTISFADSSIYWAVLLVVVIAGTYLVFRRRDVS